MLASLGCSNSRQVQTDLVHRQMRLQEDEIYRLEDYLEEYQLLVRDYRCEVEDLKRQLAERGNAGPEKAASPVPTPAESEPEPFAPGPDATMPEIELPDTELPEPTTPAESIVPEAAASEAPPFNAGAEIDSQVEPDNRVELARAVAPVLETPPAPYPATPAPPTAYPTAQSPPPTVPIDPPTGVDDSLRLTVSPGAEPDELLVRVTDTLGASRGRLSVMLTDPTVGGRLRRIARWDYTPEETADAAALDSEGGSQFQLPIALPKDTPRGRPLRLWVRLVGEEGRRLQAVPLVVGKDGRPEGYTAAPPRRLPATALPPEPEAIASVLPKPLKEPDSDDGWRAARRSNRSILTVSYEEPAQ